MASSDGSGRRQGGRRIAATRFLLALAVLALIAPVSAHAAPGDIYVADPGAFTGGGVISVNPTTGARTTVSENTAPAGGPSFTVPWAIALEADGDILVADQQAFGGSGGVIRVDPTTGARTTVSENTAPAGGPSFVAPTGIAVEADGDILVADLQAFGGSGGVIRVDPTTGARTTVSANTAPAGGPSFDNPNSLAVASNGDIVVADDNAFALPLLAGTGGVIRVNPATGARTTISENTAPVGAPLFSDPSGVALEANGDILVGDPNAFAGSTGGVIGVNPATGARTTVSENTAPLGGPSFAEPFGVALEAEGDILVADMEAFGGSGGVVRVDPTTGARTTASENTAPAGGPSFDQPTDVAVVPNPPDTTIDSGPSDPTNDPTPEFAFSSNQAGSSFECRVDTGSFSSCTSPHTTASLSDAEHTFEVRAINAAGSTDESAASQTFTVDTQAPDAPQITATAPASPANDNDPEVKGTAPADATDVSLYKDDASCTEPAAATGSKAAFEGAGITVAVTGDHTTALRARATDAAGNASACSDPFSYTEDSTAPAAPAITATDPDSPANENHPEVIGTAPADAAQVRLYKNNPSCTGPANATGSKAAFEGTGITVAVTGNQTTDLRARATDAAGNPSACSDAFAYTEDSTPPETTIDSGPSDTTNDPTPTFAFSSPDTSASFECKVASNVYTSCTSPETTSLLTEGAHTIYIRATDPAGNLDPTPASRTFTVRTAAVHVSGSTLVVTAAAGAKDNLEITRPSASVLRVTDLAGGAYTGSGVHAWGGCTRSGDYTANCNATGITLIRVAAGVRNDRVVNSTAIRSSLDGGATNDLLIGGPNRDTLTGGTGADVIKGMNGNDEIFARDLVSDTSIDCDGGTTQGSADTADLDLLPKDPDSAVTNCETKTRH